MIKQMNLKKSKSRNSYMAKNRNRLLGKFLKNLVKNIFKETGSKIAEKIIRKF